MCENKKSKTYEIVETALIFAWGMGVILFLVFEYGGH